MMGPMVTDDTWMGNVNYTINNMDGALPFVPKFEIKASGSYTIPVIEPDLGIRFRWHSGRPIWKVESYPSRTSGGASRARSSPAAARPGSSRARTPIICLPVTVTDLRLEKAIPIRKHRFVPHRPRCVQHLQHGRT